MSTPKIVTKVRQDGSETAFWLDQQTSGVVCRNLPAWERPDSILFQGLGKYANFYDFEQCGTTLAAIRAELLTLETPEPEDPPTQRDQLERLALQKFAGLMMACANAGTDGGYIQDTAVELGLMVPTICDESCEYCCGEPGEDTCYRPRYAEDGTPIGDTTRKDGTG